MNNNYVIAKLEDGGEVVLHPELAQTMHMASAAIKAGATVYFKWDCLHCGARQTFEEPNAFHIRGTCEECKNTSDLLSPSAHVGILLQAGTPMSAIDAIFGEK